MLRNVCVWGVARAMGVGRMRVRALPFVFVRVALRSSGAADCRSLRVTKDTAPKLNHSI